MCYIIAFTITTVKFKDYFFYSLMFTFTIYYMHHNKQWCSWKLMLPQSHTREPNRCLTVRARTVSVGLCQTNQTLMWLTGCILVMIGLYAWLTALKNQTQYRTQISAKGWKLILVWQPQHKKSPLNIKHLTQRTEVFAKVTSLLYFGLKSVFSDPTTAIFPPPTHRTMFLSGQVSTLIYVFMISKDMSA